MDRQVVSVIHPVLEKQEEYVISGDFVLPEYCPDIAVVLKCMVTPYVNNRQWSNGQLLLDGIAVVRVLYLDEERRCVREAEFSHPLSCTLRADTAQAPVARIAFRQEYVNCRATSPRRLEVRGAYAVMATAYDMQTNELLSEEQQAGLHYRTVQAATSLLKVSTERVLALSDVIDFEAPAELLLGGDCWAVVQECKLLAGKAIVKGQVFDHQLYAGDSEEGKVRVIDHTIPFSQIVDLPGAEESDRCVAEVSVLSDSHRCAINAEGVNTALEINLKLLIQVQVLATQTMTLVQDAYHTHYPSALTQQDVMMRCYLGTHRETLPWQKRLELPDGEVGEILDIWAYPGAATCCCADAAVRVDCRLHICMLVRDGNGAIAYYERPEELETEFPCDGNTASAAVAVQSVSYTVVSGHLELRIGLNVNIEQWIESSVCAVQDLTLKTEEPYEADRASIRLYYAQPGERIWDIARDCHTSPAAIMHENDINGDVTERRVLVVPMCE